MAVIGLAVIFSLSLLKIHTMAVIIGWVKYQPGSSLRDWSTFTTTFPGPNLGYIKVFQIQSCCPSVDPPIDTCDVFLNRGEQIILMQDFGVGMVKATGIRSYTDIAILNGKLYARTFTGSLDEYTIGATDLTLTTPDIHNIGSGTGLTSDGTYLIYDINSGPNSGKIARTTPGGWAQELYALPDPVVLQGDIMSVGGNQLLLTTFEAGSSMMIIDNDPTTPTINSNFVIKDTANNTINAVYGIFQKNGVIYIVRADGTYYSMGTTWPIVFNQEGQITISGSQFSDWNGAAQNGECGTVVPPVPTDPTPTFNGSITNNGLGQAGVYISTPKMDDSIQSIMDFPGTLDMTTSNTFNSSTGVNSVGPYRIRFVNDPVSTSTITASVMVSVDGLPFTEIDNATMAPGDDYDQSFTYTPTTSINFIVVITRVAESIGYTVEIHNDSVPDVSSVILTTTTLKGVSSTIIPDYTVDLDSVPPTDVKTGSADFQDVTFQFVVGDIPNTKADIYYKIDGGPEVFIITDTLANAAPYIRSFTQPNMATTNFTLIYKFKQA